MRDKNARQCHTALLEACSRDTLPYRTVAKWAYAFCRGREHVHQCHIAIIAVEQSVRRLVEQDTLDDIRRLPYVCRWVFHVGRDYF